MAATLISLKNFRSRSSWDILEMIGANIMGRRNRASWLFHRSLGLGGFGNIFSMRGIGVMGRRSSLGLNPLKEDVF
jgi:hypothetical protein